MHGHLAALALALLVSFTQRGAHAETFTRGSAVARALTQNPQIAASRAAEAQARARQGQADAARYPTLSATLAVGPALQARLATGSEIQSTESAYADLGLGDLTAAFGARLEVVQALYTFGKIDRRLAATEHEIRARSAETDITRADVALQVAQLYETLLFARELERFFDDTLFSLTHTLEATQSALDTDSSIDEQDVLRLQAALGALRLGWNQAHAGLLQAAAGLRAYLDLPADTRFDLQEATLEPLATRKLEETALIALALKQRPELAALREGQAALDNLADAEQADALPDVFALAFVSGVYTPGRDLVDTRFYADPLNQLVPGLLLGMRWQYQPGAATQRADVTRARSVELARTRQWASLGAPAEVTRAFQDWQRAKADLAAAEPALRQTKVWMVRAAADYGVGLGDSSNLTDAASAYTQLRVAWLSAILHHNVALADLAKATGTLHASDGWLYPNQAVTDKR